MPGSAIFKKLNLKDQKDVYVLNAPDSFEEQIRSLGEATVHRTLTGGALIYRSKGAMRQFISARQGDRPGA
jgi:hypothetical protein